MKICVVGTGYVGLVTGACLADFGNTVICIDNNAKRISSLKKGKVPFYEPELPELVIRNIKAGRLSFSNAMDSSVRKSQVIFITVGTPAKPDGDVDISTVIEVANGIARAMKHRQHGSKHNNNNRFKTIVNKSTVPVGMGDVVSRILKENGIPEKCFSVVSNPEFLREGSAVKDFVNPSRIVIGASSNKAFNVITELYRPLNAHIIFTDIKSAELIKYASNAFLATKISFINEIANVCEKIKVDVMHIADAIGLDRRIGRDFLNAGLGYGGSCFPKDVLALQYLAKSNNYDPQILAAVHHVNELQVPTFVNRIVSEMQRVKGRKITVLGLAFKPGTDDLREAPALKLIDALLKMGAKINAYDPVAETKAKKMFPMVSYYKEISGAVKGADAIVIATEWPEFREMDLAHIRQLVKQPFVFDGRNLYNPKRMKELGFKYYGVGR